MKSVVFTDLDGTLLDPSSYSWEAARPALQLLLAREIPLVFCSSKTRTEIELYRRRLDNQAPFVSENGGGIFIPEGYFGLITPPPELVATRENGYLVIRLGAPYHLLRQALQALQREGFALTGFGDMSVTEVSEVTGLTLAQAAMAKERDFDEPFIFNGSPAEGEKLLAEIQARGFFSTQGRFFHILGKSDKGTAVAILCNLFRERFGKIHVVALGDSPNDLPMLKCADQAIVIRQPNGSHDHALAMPRAIKTDGIGPAGWNEAIMRLFGEDR